MWVVDKSLPRPNGHQDGYWSFQEASACALQLCRFQIGPGQNWEMWYVWKTWENWFYFRWMKYDEVVVFRPVTRHAPLVAIEFRKYVYKPCDITGKVHLLGWVGTTKRIIFLVAVCVGIACRVAGHRSLSGQLATEGGSMIMYQYDLLMDRDNRRWFWKQNTQLKLP